MSKKRIKAPDLGPCEFIKVYWDSVWQEYSVTVQDKPEATYFTTDRADALSTAQAMRNSYLIEQAQS